MKYFFESDVRYHERIANKLVKLFVNRDIAGFRDLLQYEIYMSKTGTFYLNRYFKNEHGNVETLLQKLCKKCSHNQNDMVYDIEFFQSIFNDGYLIRKNDVNVLLKKGLYNHVEYLLGKMESYCISDDVTGINIFDCLHGDNDNISLSLFSKIVDKIDDLYVECDGESVIVRLVELGRLDLLKFLVDERGFDLTKVKDKNLQITCWKYKPNFYDKNVYIEIFKYLFIKGFTAVHYKSLEDVNIQKFLIEYDPAFLVDECYLISSDIHDELEYIKKTKPMLFENIFDMIDYNDKKSIELYIKNGCNLNKRGVVGTTPLLYSIANDKLDIANMLITAGADTTLTDSTGDGMIQIVTARNYGIKLKDNMPFITKL